jgi:hypothetical protein
MPSVSKAQRNFMRAVSHSKKFADKVDVPQSVGREFEKADEAKARRISIKRAFKKVNARP